jgi:uncharacterized protein DUF3592
MLGMFFGLCLLVAVVATAFDTYQDSAHAKWPSVVATITQQTVQRVLSANRHGVTGYVWYIQSGLRYRVDGEELTSSMRSRVTGSMEERAMMQRWVAQHQPGTSLSVRYNPRHHDTVVPNAAEDMPETGPQVRGDLNMILIFLVPSVGFITVGRVLQRRQEARAKQGIES